MEKNSQSMRNKFVPRTICLVICLFFGIIHTSCSDGRRSGETIENRYISQLIGLRDVAKSFDTYLSNGLLWNKWLATNSELYARNEIVYAEVQDLTSVNTLIVKPSYNSRMLILGQTIPAVGQSSCSRGRIVTSGKESQVIEYLEKTRSLTNKELLIRIVVRTDGMETDSASALTVWNRMKKLAIQRAIGTDHIKESSFRNKGADPEQEKEQSDLRH